MAIPDFQSIMLPLLELSGDGEIRHVSAAVDTLALGFALTDAEMNELLPSGKKPRFRDRVSWAAHYLKKAGLLESPKRAHYRITASGRGVLADSPPKIDVKFLEQFDEFVDSRTQRRKDPSRIDRSGAQPVVPPTSTPEEALQDAYQTLRSSLVAEVLDAVRKSPPTFFENLVVDVLVRMGYGGSRQEAGQAIGRSGDEGIDGIIKEDRLGLDIIYIQAKRWESVVGRSCRRFRNSQERCRVSGRERASSSQRPRSPVKRLSTQPRSKRRSFSSGENSSPSSCSIMVSA